MQFEREHARKFSNLAQLTDVYNRLMDRSHPCILRFYENFRLKRRQDKKHDDADLPPEVLAMTVPEDDNIVHLADLPPLL